jgi:PucR-like helix-turn-helix protein
MGGPVPADQEATVYAGKLAGKLVGDDRTSEIVARRTRLAALLRPELSGLVDEVVREVRRALPEYGRLGQAQGAVLRRRVDHLARLFVDLVEGPERPRNELDRIFRALGRIEGHAGRTLDPLHAAFRLGGRVAWRRIALGARPRALSAADVSWLGDRLFAFLDDLAVLSVQGHRDARQHALDADHGRRRRLLRLVLKRPAVSPAMIGELAGAAGWPVPEQCAVVALDTEPIGLPEPALGVDVLADLHGREPCLLLSAPVTTEVLQRLSPAFRGAHVAVGPTVALADAASSLRWARQALRLIGDGVLPDVPVTVCAEHWSTLWLLTDAGLLRQVTKRRLAPLVRFPAKQRSRLAGTLFAWLRAQGNVAEAAERLSVHPRTVRYRMRQVENAFGDELRDPDARFEIEAALRALDLLGLPCG